MDDFGKEVVKAIVPHTKEIVHVARPIVEPTVEIIATIPRAINAALAPVRKWILQRERTNGARPLSAPSKGVSYSGWEPH